MNREYDMEFLDILMNIFRRVIFIMLLCLFAAPLFSETLLDKSFSEYGIESIGIYTEGYKDARSDNFLAEILVMKENTLLNDPGFYRYRYCNYDLVTPPLTTPGYPLNGTTSGAVNNSLEKGLAAYMKKLGWKTDVISDFTSGGLTELLKHAADKNLDAVLVARYTPINYIVPIENYNESWLSGRKSAATGALQTGIGLIPALELYDIKTGARLWYSAYHTGHQIIIKKETYQSYADKAEEFFIILDTSDVEEDPELAVSILLGEFDNFFMGSNADEEAVSKMIDLTMKEVEQPFPDSSNSEKRNDSRTGEGSLRHALWTDYPSYGFYGTKWGIGYTFDYMGKFNLYYRDNSYGFDQVAPEVIETDSNAVMHKLTIPFYSIATGNLSIDPGIYVGYVPPFTQNISYTEIKKDYPGYTKTPGQTAKATVSAFSVGLDLSVKYYLRIADKVSFYGGVKGSAGTYFPIVESELSEKGDFKQNGEGLLFIDGPDLTVTASIMAGIRFDRQKPFEVFALYTPVGQSGDPVFSIGIKWMPFTYGWVEPYSTNIANGLFGY